MKEIFLDGYPVVNYYYKETPWKQPSKGELRLAMMALHPNCYWCGIEVKNHPPILGIKSPSDLGTIDHVIGMAHRGKGGVVPKVIACNRCNIQRSKMQNPNSRKFHPTANPQL